MIEAIAAGHLCVDIIPQISEAAGHSAGFLVPGRLTETGGLLFATGGSVSNTGVSLHRLGTDVRLLARIGDDAIGQLTREVIRGRGEHLADTLISSPGEAGSYTIVIGAPGFDRTFLHCPSTNSSFGPEDVPDALLRDTRLFHFGYPPLMRRMYAENGAGLADIFSRARAAGATTSLDMVMPDPTQPGGQADWGAILRRVLPDVTLFVPSLEELLFTLRRARYEELAASVGAPRILDTVSPAEVADLAAEVLAYGAAVAVLKLGHRGMYVRSAADLATRDDLGRGAPAPGAAWAGRELWAPCFRVGVVGTVGSGDAAIAGLLTAVLRGQDPVAAITSAVAVGACNVEAADATSGVRSWAETQARIAAGWARFGDGPADPAWIWDAAAGIWHGPHDH